ncbi:MAG: tetratricopeptide repeat protein [Alphaproteobacteria bacterium]|jgi:tetratricopeptide (TPR) repeat protein|nr:tetratricopeptide repeat protein [Alphaproteobacteria bacterium]
MNKILGVCVALVLLTPSAHASGIDVARQGYELGSARQHTQAVEQFRKALELGNLDQKQKAKTYYNLGTSELFSGNPDRALKAFEQAEKLEPKNPDLLLNKSEAHRQLGQAQEAWKAAHAANAFRSDANANYQEGLTLINLGQSKEATILLEKAVDDDSKNKDYRLAYGKVLATSGDYEKAEDILTDLLKDDAWIAQAYLYRAMSWRGLGQETKARADLTTAVQIAPDDPVIRSIYKQSRWSKEERNVKQLTKDVEGYTEPNTKSVSMMRLKKGQEVEVLKCQNGWCRVEVNGSYAGFVRQSVLK